MVFFEAVAIFGLPTRPAARQQEQWSAAAGAGSRTCAHSPAKPCKAFLQFLFFGCSLRVWREPAAMALAGLLPKPIHSKSKWDDDSDDDDVPAVQTVVRKLTSPSTTAVYHLHHPPHLPPTPTALPSPPPAVRVHALNRSVLLLRCNRPQWGGARRRCMENERVGFRAHCR